MGPAIEKLTLKKRKIMLHQCSLALLVINDCHVSNISLEIAFSNTLSLDLTLILCHVKLSDGKVLLLLKVV